MSHLPTKHDGVRGQRLSQLSRPDLQHLLLAPISPTMSVYTEEYFKMPTFVNSTSVVAWGKKSLWRPQLTQARTIGESATCTTTVDVQCGGNLMRAGKVCGRAVNWNGGVTSFTLLTDTGGLVSVSLKYPKTP